MVIGEELVDFCKQATYAINFADDVLECTPEEMVALIGEIEEKFAAVVARERARVR